MWGEGQFGQEKTNKLKDVRWTVSGTHQTRPSDKRELSLGQSQTVPVVPGATGPREKKLFVLIGLCSHEVHALKRRTNPPERSLDAPESWQVSADQI